MTIQLLQQTSRKNTTNFGHNGDQKRDEDDDMQQHFYPQSIKLSGLLQNYKRCNSVVRIITFADADLLSPL